MDKFKLKSIGWNSEFEALISTFPKDYKPGRISARHKNNYRIMTSEGDLNASISGKMHHRNDYPVVGDWIAFTFREDGKKATIHEILPRRTKVSRKAPGEKTTEQIIATNIDIIFIVASLNKEFNPKRIERYLTIIQESGAQPVIVLNKADICPDIPEKIKQLEKLYDNVPIHIISALENKGLKELKSYFREGSTVALLGSSGVGKSTLINAIMGYEISRVQDVRATDDRGRHTTTHRELYLLPDGGMVIDNPGMREIQLINVQDGIRDTFVEIEEIAKQCKFKDCKHGAEPNCAVKDALNTGLISPERMDNYNKLKREVRYSTLKDSLPTSRAVEKSKWEQIVHEANKKDGFNHLERPASKGRRVKKHL